MKPMLPTRCGPGTRAFIWCGKYLATLYLPCSPLFFFGGRTRVLLLDSIWPLFFLGAPLFAFLSAVLMRRFYQGTLHDVNGVRPWPLSIGCKRTVHLEMNLVLVIAGIVLFSAALYRFHQAPL